jgi:hypothetical protein
VTRRAKRTVHDEVRIAANGRREMRVARRGEAEVAQVLWCVARLLHRAKHQKRDRLLFGFAFDALQELLEMSRAE